jgi:hypothetical protein
VTSSPSARPRRRRRPPAPRRAPRRARELADLEEDVVARADSELDREARREAQLVDAVQVRRICDGDAEHLVLERVRDRDDALEDVHLDVLHRRLVDAGHPEVDERQAMARREDLAIPRWRRRLLDERGGKRPSAGRGQRERELVGTSFVAASRSTTSSTAPFAPKPCRERRGYEQAGARCRATGYRICLATARQSWNRHMRSSNEHGSGGSKAWTRPFAGMPLCLEILE